MSWGMVLPREQVSGQVNEARWVVEQLRGLVSEWVPPAAQQLVSGRVDSLAAQIIAVAPDVEPGRVGCAVFQRAPIYDRDYRNGLLYTPVSAVFEQLGSAESALDYARKKRAGDHIICWLTEHQRLTATFIGKPTTRGANP